MEQLFLSYVPYLTPYRKEVDTWILLDFNLFQLSGLVCDTTCKSFIRLIHRKTKFIPSRDPSHFRRDGVGEVNVYTNSLYSKIFVLKIFDFKSV